MRLHLLLSALLCATVVPVENAAEDDWKHHHHHHNHRRQGHIRHGSKNVTSEQSHELLAKIRRVVHDLDSKVEKEPRLKGTLEMNAPLPKDFAEIFANGAASATGYEPEDVSMVMQKPLNARDDTGGPLVEVSFEAPAKAVKYLEAQAQDPDSKLAAGVLCPFLVARDADGGLGGQCGTISTLASGATKLASESPAPAPAPQAVDAASPASSPPTDDAKDDGAAPVPEAEPSSGKALPFDVDTNMPYGDLEPFGREDTAQELTEKSITESDAMVDQLERAEVAEEKRAVFRALTRLRGAAITAFDGVARAQTGNIDDFAKDYKWRDQHPVHHLAQQESDISKWAFPDF